MVMSRESRLAHDRLGVECRNQARRDRTAWIVYWALVAVFFVVVVLEAKAQDVSSDSFPVMHKAAVVIERGVAR